jgi:hypothetical protein
MTMPSAGLIALPSRGGTPSVPTLMTTKLKPQIAVTASAVSSSDRSARGALASGALALGARSLDIARALHVSCGRRKYDAEGYDAVGRAA